MYNIRKTYLRVKPKQKPDMTARPLIVERLREAATNSYGPHDVLTEAADEIERLNKLLAEADACIQGGTPATLSDDQLHDWEQQACKRHHARHGHFTKEAVLTLTSDPSAST